jgi:serine/threonine protein kinase
MEKLDSGRLGRKLSAVRRRPSTTETGAGGAEEESYSWSSNKDQLEESYVYVRKLGAGSFGVVCMLKDKISSLPFACKIIKKREGSYNMMEREVEIMKSVKHEHIVQLKEVFETPQKFYLIME